MLPEIKSHEKTTADAGNHRPIERNRILSNQRECGEKGESSALKVRENEDGEKNMAPLTNRSSQSATTEQIPGSQEACDGSQHGESVWKGGYSIQAMVGTWLTLAIISVFLLFLSLLGVFPSTTTLGVLVFVMWGVAVLVFGWRSLGTKYELTTRYFISQTGVLARKTSRIAVAEIAELSFVQGPVQRLLGVGRMKLGSSDQSGPQLHASGIARVKTVAGVIDDVRRNTQHQQGNKET